MAIGRRLKRQRAQTISRARTALNTRLDLEGGEAGRRDRPPHLQGDCLVLHTDVIESRPPHYSITFDFVERRNWQLPFFVVTFTEAAYGLAKLGEDDPSMHYSVTSHDGQRPDGVWCQLLDVLEGWRS